MSKINSLVLLVKSLTKAEKRYFKLSSNLQKGTKDYLSLFNLIDQGTGIDELKNAFLTKKASASFEVSCNYLYKLILDGILHARSEKQMTNKLINDTLKVNILFEKGLYDDGLKLIHQVQEHANQYELHIIKLWAASLELSYISNFTFHTITETELLQKQLKIQSLLKYNQHINQHTSLYQLLQHRLIHVGSVRTNQQKDDLNDLLVTELNLLSKPFADTFESQKNHLLFQASYLITVGDYKSALKTFYELNTLFENRQHLWVSNLMDYLLTMEGVLNSLHGIKKYDEMKYFIDQLMLLKTHTDHQEVTCKQIVYVFQMVKLLAKGDFEEGEQLVEEYKDTIFKKINYLSVSKQATFFLYTAFIYIGLGNMKKAHYYLNHILLEGNLFHHLPVYRTFRLINLLVHFELKNHDYIAHEIRSFKRNLKSNNQKTYLLEKVILGFIQHRTMPSSTKARLQLWEKIAPKFEKIKHDKFEVQAVNLFNFSTWMEAKLCKRPFQDLIKEQYSVS